MQASCRLHDCVCKMCGQLILALRIFCVQAHLSEDPRLLRVGAFSLVNILLLAPEALHRALAKLRVIPPWTDLESRSSLNAMRHMRIPGPVTLTRRWCEYDLSNNSGNGRGGIMWLHANTLGQASRVSAYLPCLSTLGRALGFLIEKVRQKKNPAFIRMGATQFVSSNVLFWIAPDFCSYCLGPNFRTMPFHWRLFPSTAH